MLSEAVVKIVADPSSFVFTDLEDLPFEVAAGLFARPRRSPHGQKPLSKNTEENSLDKKQSNVVAVDGLRQCRFADQQRRGAGKGCRHQSGSRAPNTAEAAIATNGSSSVNSRQ